MNRQRRLFLVLLLVAAMLLAACAGGATPAPPTATVDIEATEGTDEGGEVAEESEEADLIEEPTEEPEATEELEETEEPEAVEEAEEEADPSELEALSLEEVESINSFRVRMQISSEGEAFEEDEEVQSGTISLEGAITKEPPAQQLKMVFDVDSEEMAMFGEGIEFIQVGDTAYTKLGGEWIQVPAEEAAPDVNQFLFIQPEDITEDLERLERVGEEEISGRRTIHYRGDREAIAELDQENDEEVDLENLDEAQLDIWIDQEENFIVRMEMVLEGTGINQDQPEASGRVAVLLEYFDINEDFTIELPEELEAGAAPNLSTLLGFDLELPEGAEVNFVGPQSAQFTVPLDREETRTFIEEGLEVGGYELVEEESRPRLGSFTFTLPDTNSTLTVVVREGDEGNTNVIISSLGSEE
ncbi:MAG: LppX_LprAFG lipoprotein [Chloroflexota bacterium]|nr:LppX_LprAFG lipoprotein [Chloroflexota bacterium]